MNAKSLLTLLAISSSSLLLAADAKAASGKKGGFDPGMIMIIVVFVLMIFMFSRSNKKQQQKRMEMLDRIVKGTRVMLNSGVYGTIVEVREKSFIVEIAPNVRIEVVKNGVASNEDAAAQQPESKKQEKADENVEKKG